MPTTSHPHSKDRGRSPSRNSSGRSRSPSRSRSRSAQRPYFFIRFENVCVPSERKDLVRFHVCVTSATTVWYTEKVYDDFVVYEAQMAREWSNLGKNAVFPQIPLLRKNKLRRQEYIDELSVDMLNWLETVMRSRQICLHEQTRRCLDMPEDALADVRAYHRAKRRPKLPLKKVQSDPLSCQKDHIRPSFATRPNSNKTPDEIYYEQYQKKRKSLFVESKETSDEKEEEIVVDMMEIPKRLSMRRAFSTDILQPKPKNEPKLDDFSTEIEELVMLEEQPLPFSLSLTSQISTASSVLAYPVRQTPRQQRHEIQLLDAMTLDEYPDATRVLVYPISYWDVCLIIHPKGAIGGDPFGYVVRPKPDCSKKISTRLNEYLDADDVQINEYSISHGRDKKSQAVIGFQFGEPLYIGVWTDFISKQSLPDHLMPRRRSLQFEVSHVILPIFMAVLDKWLYVAPNISAKGSVSHVFMASGFTPASNKDGEITPTPQTDDERSTYQVARLISKVLDIFYEAHFLVTINDYGNMSNYEDNILFMHKKLRPELNRLQCELAEIHGPGWKKFFSVTCAFSEGSSSRYISLRDGLAAFRPDLLHVDKFDSFWEQFPRVRVFWDEDVKFIPYEINSTHPPLYIHDVQDADVLTTTLELKKWRNIFVDSMKNPLNDMTDFWVGTAQNVVLCVLLVRTLHESKFYRGVSMEVSLQTGSLCAERNAVGNALTDNPSIRRQDFRIAAIVSISRQRLRSIRSSPLFRADSISSVHSAMLSPFSPYSSMSTMSTGFDTPQLSIHDGASEYGGAVSDGNPRGPCGACREWFSKISEVNPGFRVLTVTDETCDYVFVHHFT